MAESAAKQAERAEYVRERCLQACRSWFEHRRTWEQLVTASLTTANSILNTSIQAQYAEDSAHWGALQDLAGFQHQVADSLFLEGRDLVGQLQSTMNHMSGVLSRMKASTDSVQTLCDACATPTAHVVGALSLQALLDISRRLVQAYTRELVLRHVVCEDICNATDRTTQLLYLSSWVDHPYVDTQTKEVFYILKQACDDAKS